MNGLCHYAYQECTDQPENCPCRIAFDFQVNVVVWADGLSGRASQCSHRGAALSAREYEREQKRAPAERD